MALIAAAAIYFAFRTETLAMFAWADAAGLAGAIDSLRAGAAPLRPWLPSWALYSLPDALWQLAFAYTLFRLAHGARRVERLAWSAIPVVIGIGLELGQALALIEGTFDPIDLALSSAAIGLAWLLARGGFR